MGINIFDIQPNVVSRDLSGKSFFIYGERKSGKTTQASRFPKPIILAFEKGYGLLSGVIAQPINKWSEALDVKRQLVNDAKQVTEGKKEVTTFKTVIIDTADIAYDQCEKYILDKEGIQYLDESQNMRAYRALSKEYDTFFQEMVKSGYTLVIISHATSKQVKENGEKFDKTIPTLPDRGFLVVSRMVDVTAYASYESTPEGRTETMLTMRGNKFLEAGSRNKYMSEKIPFTYEALREDMIQAIDKLESQDGAMVSSAPASSMYGEQSEKLDFVDTVNEIKKLAKTLHKLGKDSIYAELVEKYLGKNRRVMDCDESQIDMLGLILVELKDVFETDTELKNSLDVDSE